MKKYWLLLLLMPFIAWARPKLTNLNKPIYVANAQKVVTVVLSSNRTTGYQWFYVPGQRAVVPLSYHYVVPNTHLIGAPGEAVFTFKLSSAAFNVPTTLSLHLRYTRPWLLGDKEIVVHLVT